MLSGRFAGAAAGVVTRPAVVRALCRVRPVDVRARGALVCWRGCAVPVLVYRARVFARLCLSRPTLRACSLCALVRARLPAACPTVFVCASASSSSACARASWLL